MTEAGIDAVPLEHPGLDRWRDVRKGIRFSHQPSGFDVYGAVDDAWKHSQGELILVDYKATVKAAEVTELNEAWHGDFKRKTDGLSPGHFWSLRCLTRRHPNQEK